MARHLLGMLMLCFVALVSFWNISDRFSISLFADDSIAVKEKSKAATVDNAKANTNINFEKQIAPILIRNCLGCHNSSEASGELNMSQYKHLLKGGESGPAVVPGDVEKSYLLEQIQEGEMPPEDKGKPLSKSEIAQLTAWVKSGAKWPKGRVLNEFEFTTESRAGRDWWSLKVPVRPKVPQVKNQKWVINPIDAFVARKLEAAGLQGSSPADRVTFIRRAKFDLLGLPPSEKEIQDFCNDQSKDAYKKLIDRLLASPRYGERWGRHWLDVVRFGESNGYETNTPRNNAWPYRDYVIAALNNDTPYNQFVMQQLAGDQINMPVATGFIVGGAKDIVGIKNIEGQRQQRLNDLDDMVKTTGGAFMGMTFGCAKCHNHKFDPVEQADYYRLKALFAGVYHADRNISTPLTAQQLADSKEIREELAQINASLEKYDSQLEALDRRLIPKRSLITLDERATESTKTNPRGVTILTSGFNSVTNSPGSKRGQASDPGSEKRIANLSKGYSWFNASKNQDLFSWNPVATGLHRIWLSWGCGQPTHAHDVQYVLDLDGNLKTRNDQKVIATVDQRNFANHSSKGNAPKENLWSGLHDGGIHQLQANSRIVLRSGDSGKAVTVDVLVFQPVTSTQVVARSPRELLNSFRPAVRALKNVDRFQPIDARFVRFTITSTNQSEPCIDELEIFTAGKNPRNVALASFGAKVSASGVYSNGSQAIHQIKHLIDNVYGNSRSWISSQQGRGWVQIELAKPMKIDQIAWARDRQGRFKDRLAIEYKIEVAMTPGKWIQVASSDDRWSFSATLSSTDDRSWHLLSGELASKHRKLKTKQIELQAQLPKETMLAYAGSFRVTPEPTYRLNRGEVMQRLEVMTPGTVKSIGDPSNLSTGTTDAKRRMELAKWIVSKNNPLTARVMANRIWHYHFGQGLVKTPSNFGFLGGHPSHPELLDWLATEFVAHKWSIKHLHRVIMLSATYRQASQNREAAQKLDSSCRLLWRFPPRRLEAEPIRDSILWVSGVLDLKMGGPGYSAFKPNSNYVRVFTPRTTFGPAQWRRMIYQTKPRMEQDSIFGDFDCPDASATVAKRNVSTTSLQALNLMNSSFMVQQSDLFAKRLTNEHPKNPQAQVRRAFSLAFGRNPDQKELAGALKLIEQHGLAIFCRAIFNTNEFIYVK